MMAERSLRRGLAFISMKDDARPRLPEACGGTVFALERIDILLSVILSFAELQVARARPRRLKAAESVLPT